MALKQTVNELRQMLSEIIEDLQKAEGGNKAAAQRVRTSTIRLEKSAKNYRKESIADEKKGTTPAKKSAKTTSKSDSKSAAKSVKNDTKQDAKSSAKHDSKNVAKPASKSSAPVTKKISSRTNSKKAVVRTRSQSQKRVATARHPAR
jgi:hypothetical protein